MAATRGPRLLVPPVMDDDSFDLALELMLDDARQLSIRQGKQPESSTLSDMDVAIRLQTEELQGTATSVSDHRLSKSLQRALGTDGDAILLLQREERMAQHDHAVCVAISQGLQPPPRPASPPPSPPSPYTLSAVNGKGTRAAEIDSRDGALVKEIKHDETAPGVTSNANTCRLLASDGGGDDDDDDDQDLELLENHMKQGESSFWAASRQPLPEQDEPEQHTCTSCRNEFPVLHLIRTPCDHKYCHECLATLLQLVMDDERMFPPKCCRQIIPAEEHLHVLSADVQRRYQERVVEFSTENRTYCSNPCCAEFIVPVHIKDDMGLCPHCGKTTCIFCKKASHTGDCPNDEELQVVLQIAQQERWSRCFKCKTMIELVQGCYHIT